MESFYKEFLADFCAPKVNLSCEYSSYFNIRSHTVKKVILFPVPSRDVTNQALSGRELLNYSRPRDSLFSDIPAGDGKTIIFFTVHV